jgi:hypothetical protein
MALKPVNMNKFYSRVATILHSIYKESSSTPNALTKPRNSVIIILLKQAYHNLNNSLKQWCFKADALGRHFIYF